jgi:hypothetical protein
VRRSHLPDAPDTGPQDNVMPPAARDVAAVPVTQDRAPAFDADASPVPPFKAPEVEVVPLPVPTTAVPDPAEESPVDNDREPDDPPAATPLPTTTEPDAPPAVVPEDSTRNPVLPLVPPSAVRSATAPDGLVPELAPDTIVTLPPVLPLDRPALSHRAPPAPLSPPPTTTDTDPPAPPAAAAPVPRSRLPVDPATVLPVTTLMLPEVPDVVLAPVPSVIGPVAPDADPLDRTRDPDTEPAPPPTPDARNRAPEAPAPARAVVPELNSKSPLSPEDAELADTMDRLPEAEGPVPVRRRIAPPAKPAAVVLPLEACSRPPLPPLLVPTTTLMAPALPLVALPVAKSRDPVLLLLPPEVPELRTIRPLFPSDGTPLNILIVPVFADESPDDSTIAPLSPPEALDKPDSRNTGPLTPLCVFPLLNNRAPEAPAVAAFPDRITNAPPAELLLDPRPATKDTRPPVRFPLPAVLSPPRTTMSPPAVVMEMAPATPPPACDKHGSMFTALMTASHRHSLTRITQKKTSTPPWPWQARVPTAYPIQCL